MAYPQRMAAVGLLAGQDLSILGQRFRRIYRLDEIDDFGDLLARIDAAEQDCEWKAE